MLCALIVIVIGRSLKGLAHKGQSERGTILSRYEETIGGLIVIRSFNAEKQVSQRFEEINEKNRRTFRKLNRVLALSSPVTRFTVSSVLALLLWFGGNSILSGGTRLSGAEFVYFLLIFHSIIAPVRGIAKASYSIRKQVASLERINKVLNMTDGLNADDQNESAEVEVKPDVPAIEFSHVSYSYEDDAPVLDDLSFVLEPGSSIAIVGSVGVGKTTAAELAIKLFTPQTGSIRIYGKDTSSVSAASIREIIGFVPQDAVLFNDTVFNNIALGADKASVEEVEEAARKAGIHEFIKSLPEGYNTVVGDRGSRLSGGQKQQIALARAFLKDAPILILDEATASLDPQTAASIMDVIAELMRSRSTLLITHDEKVARMADGIIKLS
jgi:ATP-binding cassette subfamily B protein/subfamily B ATP-binding cassette protein MsbA